MAAAYVFWSCLILVAHTYALYPITLFVIYALAQARTDLRYLMGRRDRRRSHLRAEDLPAVTVVVPAYNEEACLPGKLANLAELDYPRDRLQIIIVSDGSTDRTNQILDTISDPSIDTIVLPRRGGKATALNHALENAKHELVVFSDTSTLFAPDALQHLLRHFSDPRIGVVCGALRFKGGPEFKQTEGVYWRYETMLRLMEARLGATLTASGAIFAIRRHCYRPLKANDIIDDFVIPMRARKQGFGVVFDPEAEAFEVAGSTVKDEFTRRVRIAVGSFNALAEFSRVPLNPMAGFCFFSHKLLRWILPFLLIGMLGSNLFLLDSAVYRVALLAQGAVYFWAGLGLVFRQQRRRIPFALLCYFLVAMNVAYLVGFMRFLRGRRETAWQRVS
jgi:cellulose synthase/poly-beta-1,6-N-acetylglucosamine synthase-like glycosyltransferase